MISSLLGKEVAHCSTIYENADRSMVEGSLEGQWVATKGFIDTADLESCSHRRGVILILGLGFLGEGSVCRTWFFDLQRGLGVFGAYSFPDSSALGSMALSRGLLQFGRGQSRAKWPDLRQQKHPPVLRRCSLSVSVSLLMASRSMGITPPGAW